jgi:hypothetical protein
MHGADAHLDGSDAEDIGTGCTFCDFSQYMSLAGFPSVTEWVAQAVESEKRRESEHVIDTDREQSPGCLACYLRTGETIGRAWCRTCEVWFCPEHDGGHP